MLDSNVLTTIYRPKFCCAKLVPTALAAVLGRAVFRATYHNHPLHACTAAAGQSAMAVVNGDVRVGASSSGG